MAAATALLLAACGASIDREQLRVCRSVLPALNPGTRVIVKRVDPGPAPRSLTIVYDVERIDRTPLERTVVCRFAGEGLAANKAELTAVVTEHGPLSPSNLFFLKRYYLETPDGSAGDPGSREGIGAPEVPAWFAYPLQQLLVSLPRTAIYALLAVAYALIFGLVGRINLAFGELAAVGSAATIAGAAIVSIGWGVTAPVAGLLAGLAAAGFAGAVHAAVGGHYTIARITASSTQPSLIATVGLSLALMEYLRLAQSPVTVWLPPIWSEAWPLLRAGEFLVSITPVSLATAAVGAAVAVGLLVLMRCSGFGRSWRAYADDPRAAALFGVDAPGLLHRTLALSGCLAGLSGMLIVVQYGGLGFAGGFQFGLKALIAAIIGGIGSVPGALIGGAAVGLFETVWSAYLPIEGRDMALYAALVVFLIYRPGGLLGWRDLTPRPV
ncbi:MAG TPA: branched-chain amino acid ABC transporter permease [Microvirga sp.]|nr:branched-chain amino acid ABC transporter permease [Microvirga sp.]